MVNESSETRRELEINDQQTTPERQSVGKDAVILMASKILTMAFSLIAVMLLSRSRSLFEYGTYSQINTVVSIMVSVLLLGLPNCINYFLPRFKDSAERDSFIVNYFLLTSTLSIAAGVILFILLPLIEVFYENPTLQIYAYAFAILPWGNVAFGSLSNLLVASNKTKRVIVINLAYSMLTVLIVIIDAVTVSSFEFYMMLYVALQCAFGGVSYYEAGRLISHFRFRLDGRLTKEMFRFSIPIGLAGAVGTINIELGKLIVGNMFDASTLAIYTNASKEMPLSFVAASFTAVLLPVMSKLFSEGDDKEALRLWGRSIEFAYIIICFIVAALVAFAPQAISFLYSEKYSSGVTVFCICSVVLLFRSTYFGIVLNATGNTKPVLWSSILSLIVNVLVCLTITPILGLIGPAIATLAAVAVSSAIQLVYSTRAISCPLAKLLPWKHLIEISVINVVLAGVMFLVNKQLQLGLGASDVGMAVGVSAGMFIIYIAFFYRYLKAIWRDLR